MVLTLPPLQIASMDSASISEDCFWSKVKFKNQPNMQSTRDKWYQQYSLDSGYDTPKPSKNSEISALEFVNFVKGSNGQDCRPKIFDNITKTYQMKRSLVGVLFCSKEVAVESSNVSCSFFFQIFYKKYFLTSSLEPISV